jgi:signal transduction histidine kinase
MNRKESLIDLLIHDLTGPLSIASTSVNNLINKQDRYGPVTDRQRTTLNMIMRNVNKARNILNEMVEVYHSEEGLFRKDLCSIQDILKDSVVEAMELVNPDVAESLSNRNENDNLLQLLEDKGVFIVFNGKYTATSFCHDRIKIQQVLRNLITNALKHRRRKVLISISGDTDISISVEYDGAGIPQEKQDVIFKRFSSLDCEEDVDIKGLGFGLSCVKTIVETMSGSIKFLTREEGGSCFTIQIPPLE